MKLTVLKSNVPINDVVIETDDVSEKYEIFVGRSPDCHVIIDDPMISRHLFAIKKNGSDWVFERIGPLGAIMINGNAVTKASLTESDEIRFGSYSVVVSGFKVVPQPAAELPLPEEDELPELEPPLIDEVTELDITPETDDLIEMELDEVEAPLEVVEEAVEVAGVEETPEPEMNADYNLEEPIGFDHNEIEAAPQEHDSRMESFEEAPSAELSVFDEAGTSLDTFPNEPVAEEGTRVLKTFVTYQLVLFGEYAPYDRYQMETDEVFIGRDQKKCQILLNDPEVSSVHAVVRKHNNEIILEDLNSSNGTILNGERINKAHVATGDEFVIGSTSFTLEVKSDLLDAESNRLMPVAENQVIETEEIEEEEVSLENGESLQFENEGPPEKSIIKRILKNPAQRKKAVYALVGVGLLVILFYEPEPEAPQVKDVKSESALAKEASAKAKPKVKLSKELESKRNIAYELGVSFFEQNKYFEALREFQMAVEIDPEYKKIQTYLEQTKIGLKRLEELETQKRAEEERLKTKKLVEEWLIKAREAVKEKKVQVAENFFSQITEKDPENIEVQQLKLELEAWQRDEQKKALELASKELARKRMVDSLTPGKTYYLKKEWYRAILKLEEFLALKGMDEDLVKEGSDMLSDAKNQLASELGPLVGKARSFKEGQDFKNAYEAYLEILKIEPTHAEALNEVDAIKHQLEERSRKIYREAIISESLSLFADAKEKFMEVQQISPTDSEYYKKASDKLKKYME